MKKLVVTGGAGFIGSWLTKLLVQKAEGYKIIVIDNLSSGKIDNLLPVMDRIEFENIDIRDTKRLGRLIYGADCIFHLAAVPSVVESVQKPYYTNDVNLNGTVNLLELSIKNKVKKFVFSSSSAVYGEPKNIPLSEEDVSVPLSPYGLQKRVSEEYCRLFFENYPIKTVCLRYFNVYGPNQSPDSEYAAVIAKFFDNAINNKPLRIFGDGEQTRDFIYVTDVAVANWSAFLNVKGGEIINIGTGKAIKIKELAKMIIDITGKDLKIKYEKERPGDIKHSCANIKKAQNILNFAPKYNIEEGLKRLYSSIA